MFKKTKKIITLKTALLSIVYNYVIFFGFFGLLVLSIYFYLVSVKNFIVDRRIGGLEDIIL